MGNFRPAVEVSTRNVERLRQIVIATMEAGFGPAGLPLSANGLPLTLSEYLERLIAHLMLVDGNYKPIEHEFLEALGPENLPHVIRWFALQQIRLAQPEFLDTSPAILEAAIQCDLQNRTRYAADLVNEEETLCHVLCSVDSRFPRQEANAVVQYGGLLRARLRANSLYT